MSTQETEYLEKTSTELVLIIHKRYQDASLTSSRIKLGGEKMKYLVWLKTNPAHTRDTIRTLGDFPEHPHKGIRLYYTMNVFGEWDCGIWFDADNHDRAIDFLHNKIYPVKGIVQTYLVPTSPIKEYINWK